MVRPGVPNCQLEISQIGPNWDDAQIIESEADYVLALKGNQGTLPQAVISDIDEQSENDFANVTARRHVTEETGHGRQATRSSIQMPVPQSLPGLELWKGLKSIGMVVSD